MVRTLFFGLFDSFGIALLALADRVHRIIYPVVRLVDIACERVFDLFWPYVPTALPYDWFDTPVVTRLTSLGRALLFREDRRAYIVRLGQHG